MTDKIFYNLHLLLKYGFNAKKNIIKPNMHSHIEHVRIFSLILLNSFLSSLSIMIVQLKLHVLLDFYIFVNMILCFSPRDIC